MVQRFPFTCVIDGVRGVVVCPTGGALRGLDIVGRSPLVDALAGGSQVLVPRSSDIAPPSGDILVGAVDALGEFVGVGLGRLAGFLDVLLEVGLRLLLGAAARSSSSLVRVASLLSSSESAITRLLSFGDRDSFSAPIEPRPGRTRGPSARMSGRVGPAPVDTARGQLTADEVAELSQ
jgi:hypothetical protein